MKLKTDSFPPSVSSRMDIFSGVISALLIALIIYPSALVATIGGDYIQSLYEQVAKQCTITAFLRGAQVESKGIVNRVKSLPGTRTIRLLSPPEGYREFATRLGRDAAPILADVHPDDMPITLQVTVDRYHITGLEQYLRQFRATIPEVEEVRYPALELKQSISSIERIDTAGDYMNCLLLAVGIAAGVCAFAVASNGDGKPYRKFLSNLIIGLGGGLLAALFLYGTSYGLLKIGWQMDVPVNYFALAICVGSLLGALAGFTRMIQSWRVRRSVLAFVRLNEVVDESERQGPMV